MAKPASSNSNLQPLNPPRHDRHWGIFTICMLLGVLSSVALLDYSPAQSLQIKNPVLEHNLVGMLGAELSFWAFNYIGISTWLLPVFLFWMAFTAIRNARLLAATRFAAMLLCIIAGSSLAAMFAMRPSDYYPSGLGGALGQAVYNDFSLDVFGPFGSGLIFLILYAFGLLLIFTKDITAEFDKALIAFNAWRERRAIARAERAAMLRQYNEEQARARAKQKAGKLSANLLDDLDAPAATPPGKKTPPRASLPRLNIPPPPTPEPTSPTSLPSTNPTITTSPPPPPLLPRPSLPHRSRHPGLIAPAPPPPTPKPHSAALSPSSKPRKPKKPNPPPLPLPTPITNFPRSRSSKSKPPPTPTAPTTNTPATWPTSSASSANST